MVRGTLEVESDVNAERFTSWGAFNIRGLLNAGNVEIYLYGPCKVREIGGEKIVVRRNAPGKFLKLIKTFFFAHGGGLEVEVIEGDEIYLEATRAKIVRGNKVEIGPECEIEVVEYLDELTVVPEAKVKVQRKIE